MAEAAHRIAREDEAIGDSLLLRRLLTRPSRRAPRAIPTAPWPTGANDGLVESLRAENRVIKAVLRSERAVSAELRASLAALGERQIHEPLSARAC